MKEPFPLKIDCYSHIVPPRYGMEIAERFPAIYNQQILPCPTLYDLDARFRVMDKYEPLRQVLPLGRIPTEHLAGPKEAAELARRANDEMGELVNKHRDRFCGALATLSMTDMDEALRHLDNPGKPVRRRKPSSPNTDNSSEPPGKTTPASEVQENVEEAPLRAQDDSPATRGDQKTEGSELLRGMNSLFLGRGDRFLERGVRGGDGGELVSP